MHSEVVCKYASSISAAQQLNAKQMCFAPTEGSKQAAWVFLNVSLIVSATVMHYGKAE